MNLSAVAPYKSSRDRAGTAGPNSGAGFPERGLIRCSPSAFDEAVPVDTPPWTATDRIFIFASF